MRNHAKASSAGSTMRQAKGLGRIFRGGDLTRGGSGDADGSGARSHPLPLAALALIALAALSFVAIPASAAEPLEPPVYHSSFGPDGTEATEFGFVSSIVFDQQTKALYVLDSEAGALYKFDEEGHPVDFAGTAPYINENKIEGIVVPPRSQVAVDPVSHVIYVAEKFAVRAFEADGEAHEFIAGPGAGTNKIPGPSGSESFSEHVFGVTADANGAIYVSDMNSENVYIFSSTGAPLTHFQGPGQEGPFSAQPAELAVSTNGKVYVTHAAFEMSGGSTYTFTPSSFPVSPTTTYPVWERFGPNQSKFIGDLRSRGLATDFASGDIYLLSDFSLSVRQYDKDGTHIRDFANEGGALSESSAGIGVNPAAGAFYVGSNTSFSGPGKVAIYAQPVYLPFAPTIESTTAINLTADSAKLRAKINPNTLDTTYHFEYGTEDCTLPSACTEIVPTSPDIGSGHKGVFAFAQLTGLQPSTTYHFRVIATNSEGTVKGPDKSFTTQLSASGFALPDARAWEMVSPPEKHGGKLFFESGGAVVRAAANGDGLTYASTGSLEADPEGNRALESSQQLARRGADGWHSKDITVPNTLATGAPVWGYGIFTPDLSRALLKTPNPAISPQADEVTPFLRDNTEPATYTPLLTNKEGFANVPSGAPFGQSMVTVTPRGADSSLNHVIFTAQASLFPGVPAYALYMWSAGQISVISELPAAEGGEVVAGVHLGSGSGSVRHAVSEDGSRVFWSTGNTYYEGIPLTALYLRDTVAEESVRLDTVKSGAGSGEAHPAFQGASADGTVVYFTDSQQLTEDASPEGRDLYRCEIPAGAAAQGCATLTDVSAPLAGSGESAKAKDIALAISEDGSRVYFVAEGKLDAQLNGQGDSATPGEPNLYLFEEGEGVRFIATLAGEDKPDWGSPSTSIQGYATRLSSAASPNGRYLSFMSKRSLTGYDSQDAASGEPDEEIFRYDAGSEALDCVSCNPSGASPAGEQLEESLALAHLVDRQFLWNNHWVAATLPETGGPGVGDSEDLLTPPRATLDNGRVFFNAIDSLVPADSNGEWDVYQYEPLGVGNCSASSGGSSVSLTAGGCVSLISSGTADEEAAFLDASESGDDVFFLSPAKLAETDEDTVLDVYDARVNGVPDRLTPRTECLGEACLAAPSPPNDPTPASASFQGTGNVVSQRCAKGKKLKVRSDGSLGCVAHKKHAHKARRAAHKRRAGR